MRRVVRAVLEADGFRVLEAHDGEQGLKLAASERPGVVILDVAGVLNHTSGGEATN